MEKLVKHRDGNETENPFPRADEVIEHGKAKGSEYWEKAKAKGQSLWDGTQSGSRKTWRKAKGLIQKHPAQAIGYAVLFGVIVGALFSPKRRD